MSATPKESLVRINQIANAWGTLRPTKSFAGMSLEQFMAKIKPSLDARAEITALESRVIAAQDQRDDADKASVASCQLVVNAVKGDPAEGEDGELYEALGYVRKSDRSSGLHRSQAAPVAKP